ncbi:MAG: FtsX-like permease family protein [Betaproteobacteria bacterium]|nr:FtsX-like permease family protein [Betaproteobacteria bacterium]
MIAAIRRRLLFAPLAQYKGRLALSIAAIALGVALGYAVQLINAVAIGEMARAVQTLAGDADLAVLGPRAGFDESLYPLLVARPEVALASPAIELEIRVRAPGAKAHETLKAVGIDIFRAAALQPGYAAAEAVRGAFDSLDYLRPDRVFLSESAAALLEVAAGDVLLVQLGLTETQFRIAGLLSGAAFRQPLAVLDIAAAQAASGRLGRVNRIDLRLRPGADAARFMAQVSPLLPAGVWLEPPQASIDRAAGLSRSYRVNLNVLALVALFTGGLLVFSTQSLAVVRRRPHLALLRVLGVKRGALLRQALGESVALGALGAALGLCAGYLLASEALARFGADLGAGHFRGLAPEARFEPWSALLFFCLGIAVTVAGSVAAAFEAGRTPPAHALKAGDEQRLFERLAPAWPGMTLLALGAVLTQAGPVAGLPLPGYVAIALLLIGSIVLMPRLSLLVFGALSRAISEFRPARGAGRVMQAGPELMLAVRSIAGAPGQTMVSLAASVASVSLMVSMAIMVASFRTSLDQWLEQVLPADLYLRGAGGSETTFLTPADQARLAALPGVRRVDFMRSQRILLAQDRPPVLVIARDINESGAGAVVPLLSEVKRPAGAAPSAWITEGVADLYGWRAGQTVSVPLAGKQAPFFVAGVWRDYVRQQGAILIERSVYRDLTGDALANDAAFWLTADSAQNGSRQGGSSHSGSSHSGSSQGGSIQGGSSQGGSSHGDGQSARVQLRRAIRALPGGEALALAEPGEIRALSLKIFDRTFAVTYGLEAVAVLIGLFGLSASFGALVLARRREFGVLRHLGMTRRQIGVMLAAEGAMVSALGLAVGLALGWLISLVLIHVVNRQSFHWSMEVHMPWAGLAAFVTVMLVLSTLTAVASGRQAMGGDAVRAVKEDW